MSANLDLKAIEQHIKGLTPEGRSKLETATSEVKNLCWVPQAGPQMEAYYCKADELLYGGAAGGGKTDLIIGLALTRHRRSLLFRRQAVDLEGMWDRLVDVVSATQSSNSVKKKMLTVDDRLIEMGHLEANDSEKAWQGREHSLIGCDEAAQLSEQKILFVTRWLRDSKFGNKCRLVLATNPPLPEYKNGRMVDGSTGAWLKLWFAPWLDKKFPYPAKPGELRWCYMRQVGDRMETIWVDEGGWYNTETSAPHPDPTDAEKEKMPLAPAKTRTFIKSLVSDNIFLRDSGYREHLAGTPEPLRSMLLNGEFGVKLADHKMQVIPTAWVELARERWETRQMQIRTVTEMHLAPQIVLAADIAQGGIDSTVIAALREDNMYDEPETYPGSDTPDGQAVVIRLLASHRDGSMIVLDGTGGWAGSTKENLQAYHKIKARTFTASEKDFTWTADHRWQYYNMRAKMWWQFREALDPQSNYGIMLPPNDALLGQLTSPHWTLKGNELLIESKDSIRVRLGSSTDEADAVLMAWQFRTLSIAMKNRIDPTLVAEGGWNVGRKDRDPDMQIEMVDPLENW